MDSDAGAGEPVDRFAVEVVRLAVAQERARPSLEPERPVAPAGPSSLLEPHMAPAATSRLPVRAPASTSSTSAQPNRPRSSCSHARSAAASAGSVAALTVVQHRRCVVGHRDRPALASRGRVLDAGPDQLQRRDLAAPRQAASSMRLRRSDDAGRLADRLSLVDQRRRRRELRGVEVNARELGER